MIKEALEFLSSTIGTYRSAKLLTIPGDGRQVYVDQNGKLDTIVVQPSLRHHEVASVEDLIAAAGKWNDDPTIWVSPKAIVLVTDDGDRRDTVTLPLVKSAAFKRLEGLQAKPTLNQLELLRTLRVDFGSATSRADLIAAVRNLKWRTSASGHSNVTQGNESLGKTIENEVTGGGDIPESVTVAVPVYSNPGEIDKRYPVLCDLEIVPSEQAFLFRPVADELEHTLTLAQGDMVQTIRGSLKDVPVFFGNP